jgi:hypothetical protein
MRRGDEVVVIADPLRFGLGTIQSVTRKGNIVVRFGEGDEAHVRVYAPHDLELASIYMDAA